MVQEIVSNNTNEKKGIDGSTLKLIAIVTMLIDHVGAVVIWRMILDNAAKNGLVGMVAADGLLTFYQILRGIGRIAFPIFCFLLVEGFQKTHNKMKYALRLGAFALVSEIPFDLALSSIVLEFTYQNVFFTLFIGLLTMMAVDWMDTVAWHEIGSRLQGIPNILKYIPELAIVVSGAYLAEAIHTDYGATGVMCILILYLFRKNKLAQTAAGCCAFLWETTAPFAFIPVWFYNGRRGLNLKYVFYLFYPVHLLILYIICVVLGISGFSAV